METRIITDPADLPAAAAILKLGGAVAVPTETVYGLCVNGLDAEAVAGLYELKGRPEVKPLSLMVGRAADIPKYCRDVPPAAATLAARFWPGPLTMVLPAKSLVPSILRAGKQTVGLRCPAHSLTLALLDRARLPLAGPSANPSGLPSPTTAQQVLDYFDGRIGAVLDGGPCRLGRESTVLDMSVTPFTILREGALSRDAIGAALRQGLRVVGVTGGTGGGKTTATEELRRRGALVLDCDEIYHRLTRECAPLREELTARFGPVYNGDELDRKALGAVVFSDPAALSALNAITHRYVDAEAEKMLLDFAWRGGTVAAVDAIALFESGMAEKCACTLGVLAGRETRLARIMAREGIAADYAAGRIDAQPSAAYYESRCDYLLENDGSREEFLTRCRALFDRILN